MLESVELILLMFMFFYVLILIYDFSILIVDKINSKTNKLRRNRLINIMRKNKDRKYYNCLKNIGNLKILEDLIEKRYIIGDKKILTMINDKRYNHVYEKLCFIYDRRDNIDKAYFAYILSFIKYNSNIIEKYLLKTINEKSIYCIENGLYSMYRNGNIDLIQQAYKNLTTNNAIYSSELITGGLLSFKGNTDLLCETLYKNFKSFSIQIRIGIINYYKNIKFDIAEKIYNNLCSSKKLDKQLEIAYLGYFSKLKYDKAYELFVERLDTNYYDDFDYDVIMIQALSNYSGKKVKEVLTKKLADTNYYIRLNSGKTLKKITDITKIKTKDKFAQDILKYLIEIG